MPSARVGALARDTALALVAALALLIAIAANAHAQGDTFGPNLRVNHGGDTFFQNFPDAIVCPDGTIVVAWEEWRHPSGSVYTSRSTDGGASFSVESRVDPAALPGYGEPILVQFPCVAVDGPGTVYVAWVAWSLGEVRRVWCARSTDQGATFEDPVPVSNSVSGDRSWPAIAGDAAGGVYVVWCEIFEAEQVIDLYVARSDDGTAFSEPVRANQLPVGPTCTPPLPDIDTGEEPGRVHLVWRQTNAGNRRFIYAARSDDWGVSWAFPVPVSHQPWIFDG